MQRQTKKADFIEKMNEVVGNQMTVLLNDGLQRRAQQMQQLYTTSLIIHVTYSTSYANLNDQKKQKENKLGSGANNE